MSARKLFVALPCAILVGLLLSGPISSSCHAQEVSRKDKSALRSIGSTLDRAGRQYQSGKFELSGKSITKASRLVEELATDASPELIELLKPEHAKLVKAFELLTGQGITLEAIKPLPEPMAAGGENANGEGAPDGDAVSFKDAIAPIIVSKCGRCHVRGQRGQFSAATFVSLMNSGHVDPGKPNVSRLIEVIENGDMPPGGSLLDEELATLKLWIAQGANTDAGRNDNLATLAQNAAPAAPAEPETERLKIATPSGKETVSFASDIAPVLIENCSGCHVDVPRNPRANLNMTSFRQLLVGGDSGPMLVPGSAAKSLLIKKLRGMGDGAQMPQNRPPLDESVIKMVSTWINEGATFDGGQPGMRVKIVAAKARAASLSHEELSAERKKLAAANWNTVMSEIEANMDEQADLRVISSYDPPRIAEIGEVAQTLVPKIRAAMKIKGDGPLVKGKISVFVFERRYDFNEFGVMIDGREIPRQIKARWGYDVIDANVALLMTRNETPESLTAELARQMGSTYISSIAPDAPRWFSDGMGYWIATKAAPRAEGVSQWDEDGETFAKAMAKPDDFIRGQLPDDRAALVGFYFVSQLRGKNSGKFTRLLTMLEDNQPFEEAFRAVYGSTPNEYVGGSNKEPKRRRR